jgi:hydrogenase maturation protein HypF
MSDIKATYRIKITGLVQGVGFRPFIYRLANEFGLVGTVDNRNDGVLIFVSGEEKDITNFILAIPLKAPEASNIEDVKYQKEVYSEYSDFRIVKSSNNSIKDEITEISPDIAVCHECLNDMKSQAHRKEYSFINCTHCGPRFTIIRDLPYDRPKTTMESFTLCNICEKEYKDVNDRRFHAQPVACNNCGPHYSLHIDNAIVNDINTIIYEIARGLESGMVMATKGIGGYNLICDALNEDATKKLRQSKHRDGKPLAMMFKDERVLQKYVDISKSELEMITSWRRPIVILKTENFTNKVVAKGFNSVGAMFPYMPFHYQLFEKTKCEIIVYTSANLSGEPIIKDDSKALELLGTELPVLTYNRQIHNRVDDSVGFVANNTARLLRRSRGYAPSSIRLDFSVDGILATGAELVNCFCIGRTSQAIISQHIGDLKNAETLDFYEESIERYKQLYKFEPQMVVCDLHPDYLSSRYAESLNLPIYKVQHHHAHMASVMAENKLNETVIGIVMDGTGYGTDGKIWGGEYFVGDFSGFKRISHFSYVPIPGGDSAVKEPWRIALSYLYNAYGEDYKNLDIPFVKNLDFAKADFIIQLIDKKLNSPESSSAGRLFDAVSAMLELCTTSSFHAEAPMRLEDIIDSDENGFYNYEINEDGISFSKTIKDIVIDIENKVALSRISTRFHNTIIEASCEICLKIRRENHLNKVVMSGGSFQNKYLSTIMENRLLDLGFEVYFHKIIPANDGGLALGQLAIGAWMSQHKTPSND